MRAAHAAGLILPQQKIRALIQEQPGEESLLTVALFKQATADLRAYLPLIAKHAAELELVFGDEHDFPRFDS